MHKVVIKGNYYGRTRTLPDLNDYLHECARHPQMGAKMKRDYQKLAATNQWRFKAAVNCRLFF